MDVERAKRNAVGRSVDSRDREIPCSSTNSSVVGDILKSRLLLRAVRAAPHRDAGESEKICSYTTPLPGRKVTYKRGMPMPYPPEFVPD